jgi:hypothetical protein
MHNVVLVALDGTLANARHRMSLWPVSQDEETRKREWRRYHEAAVNDTPNLTMARLVASLAADTWLVMAYTARPEAYAKQTSDWMKQHSLPINKVLMPAQQHEDPVEAKAEAIRTYFDEGMGRVAFAFDADPHLSSELTRQGVTFFQMRTTY